MSSAYKDWKDEMESNAIALCRDKRIYVGIQFSDKPGVIDSIEYELCDFICEDIEIKKVGDVDVATITVGFEYDNKDGTWTKDYIETLYLFPTDWVLIDTKTHKISVVPDKYIGNWNKV